MTNSLSSSTVRRRGPLLWTLGRFVLATAAAMAPGFGCSHTRSVGDPSAANATPPIDDAKSNHRSATSASSDDDKSATRRRRERAGEGEGRGDGEGLKGDSRPGAPVLSTSSAGLLKPKAVEDIQDKLIAKGNLSQGQRTGKIDEPTRKALQDFQRDNNIPATGMPDDVTIEKLGLQTGNIFRASGDGEGGSEDQRKSQK